MLPMLTGLLATVPLEHLLLHAAERRLRGALVLRPDGVEDLTLCDVVTWVDGMPAKVRTAEPIDHLGDVLLELGVIDESTRDEGVRRVGRGEGLLGEILVRIGKIDRATLDHALRVQIARKLTHLFVLPNSTHYGFYDGVDALAFHGGPQLLSVDVLPIVFAGLRAHPPLHASLALEKLEGAPLRLKRTADLRPFILTPEERDLLGLLRMSPMNVEQLEQAGVTAPRTARALAYALLVTGQLEAALGAPMSTPHPSIEQKALHRLSSAPVVRIALKRVQSSQPPVVEEQSGDGREENAPSSSRRRRLAAATPTHDDPRRTELRARFASLAGKSHCEVLGVAEDATTQEIASAFLASAARWHPDALPAELADLRVECERIWLRIVEAHRALVDVEHQRKSTR